MCLWYLSIYLSNYLFVYVYLFKLQVKTQCVRICKYIYIYIYAIPLRSTFSGLDRMHMKTDNTPLLTIIPGMSQWGRHNFPKRNAFCHCFSPEFFCLSSWGCYSTFVTWYVTSLRWSFSSCLGVRNGGASSARLALTEILVNIYWRSQSTLAPPRNSAVLSSFVAWALKCLSSLICCLFIQSICISSGDPQW